MGNWDLRAPHVRTVTGGGAWDPVDVYLRVFVADTGDPHVSNDISQSPDIILRQQPAANPQQAFGAGSGTEDNQMLSDPAEQCQTNYVYVRVLNRSAREATNVRVTVYWSQPASLVTPSLWNLVGSTTIPAVPAGNVLMVSDPIAPAPRTAARPRWPPGHRPTAGRCRCRAVRDRLAAPQGVLDTARRTALPEVLRRWTRAGQDAVDDAVPALNAERLARYVTSE